MIKKLLLSLGTLSAVVAPVAAVVACGTSTEYSATEQDILGKVTTSEAQQAVELDFLSKVLATDSQYGNTKPIDMKVLTNNPGTFKDDFLRIAKYQISSNLANDPSYLSKIYSSIVALAPQAITNDALEFATQIFDKTTIKTRVEALNDKLPELLFNLGTKDKNTEGWNPIVLGLKNTILKEMITINFLKLTKAEWSSVFESESIALPAYIDDTTNKDTKNFLAIEEVMKSKMALKWEGTLDETDSSQFISTTKSTSDNVISALGLMDVTGKDTKVTDFTKWSDKTNRLIYNPFTNTNTVGTSTTTDNLIGYKGVTSLPSGEEGLLFTSEGIKKQGETPSYARTGILEDGKIISVATDPVKYIQEGGKTFDVTFVKSLMPTYVEDKTDATKSSLKFGSDIDLNVLLELLVSQNSGLWQEALKYYTTEVKDATNGVADKPAVEIQINNEAVAKLWIDKGLSYVKYVAKPDWDTTTK